MEIIFTLICAGLFYGIVKLAASMPDDPKIDTVKGAYYKDYYIDDEGIINYIKHINIQV